MNRVIETAVVLGVMLLGPATVEAGEFFLGAGVGQSQTRDTLRAQTFEASETAWEAWFGYELMPFVFFEASYIDFGTFEDTEELAQFRSDVQGAALWAAGTRFAGRRVGVRVSDVLRRAQRRHTRGGRQTARRRPVRYERHRLLHHHPLRDREYISGLCPLLACPGD